MGWYDAFHSNVKPIDLNNVSSQKGSAYKNFGDAFSDIGKSMREVDTERSKEKVATANAKAATSRANFYTTQNGQAVKDDKYNNSARTNKSASDKRDANFTNAFNSLDTVENLKLFKDHYADNNNAGYGIISPNASAALNKKIEHTEDRANTNASQLKAIKDAQVKSTYLNTLHNKEQKINLLKIKNENQNKESKKVNPLSISSQKALNSLIISDNYVLGDNGKPEINDGKMTLREDVSPAFNDYMRQEIFSYMSAPKSDKNYENAKKKVIESWNDLEDDAPSKAQDIAFKKKKELDDRTVWQTIKDSLNPDKVDGKETVVSEENTNITPQKSSMFSEFKNSR